VQFDEPANDRQADPQAAMNAIRRRVSLSKHVEHEQNERRIDALIAAHPCQIATTIIVQKT
jgi:antibiotic biosynthesis monooxygenase (ABM) superfamily enzyme